MGVEHTTANKQDGCWVSPGRVGVLSVFLLDVFGLDSEESTVDMEERGEQDRRRNVIIRDRVEKENLREVSEYMRCHSAPVPRSTC